VDLVKAENEFTLHKPDFFVPTLVITDTNLSSLDFFKKAVAQAFAGHAELVDFAADTLLADAWKSVSRRLGIDGDALAVALAPVYGVPLAQDLYDVQAEVLSLVPFHFCQSNTLLPLRIVDGALLLVSADPLNQEMI